MKKQKGLKRIICLALVATMIVGLCACGKAKEEETDYNAFSKEYVYSYEEINVTDLGDEMTVASATEYKSRIYAVLDIYHYEAEPGEEYEAKMLSMKNDGTDIKEVVLELPQEESRVDPNSEDSYEYTGYSEYTLGNNGILYALKDYYFEDFTDEENYIVEQEYSICAWNLDGTFLWETPIVLAQTEEIYNYISKMIPADDGSVIALVSGSSNYKFTVDTKGNISNNEKIENGAALLADAYDIIVKQDGTLLITTYDESGTAINLSVYDAVSDKIKEETIFPAALAANGYNCINEGMRTDIVYSAMDGIYGFNFGDEEPVQIMNFVNSDLNTSAMNQVVYLDKDHFIGFYMDNTEYANHCSVFSKVDPEDIPDKIAILMAGNYIDYDIKSRVIEFNRNSDKYRIVTKEYDSYNTINDYTVGLTKLNSDILAGQMPDILVVDDYIELENYSSKGLLADIGELIDQDPELSRDKYLENVLNATMVDGKIYRVIPWFYVCTLMGKTANVGDAEGWNMQEFLAFEKAMPEGMDTFGELIGEDFLYMMLQYCGMDFVNMSTGECKFNSEEFISMLEYAKALPTEYSMESEEEDYYAKYREDRTALMDVYFSSVQEMSQYMNGYFGEDVNFIGFPSEDKNGSVLMFGQSFALSANTETVDGAWEFIRYYLTDEYQNSLYWEFPVSKEAFAKNAQEALEKPYYYDENEEKVYYDNYVTINDESVVVEPLKQEQIDQVVDMVMSTDKEIYYDVNIENIIMEEAAAFFEEQKSAEEVAQIIQNRAQTYVDENR